ncbi:hypothetical protein PV05_04202 [Exophiala xenobiotica]|uniref:RING-type domain-containing protein n=1 Tax=Exophiala xenobiotica TaxID=348802 RepID=A0A0D2BSK7_9EURO|nr:uncharacterized protein PV05_04202 [Exophiala xenobiotica]KIW55461.1 hypothetical protein PV05_04202 [Exophiala xenobiotica]
MTRKKWLKMRILWKPHRNLLFPRRRTKPSFGDSDLRGKFVQGLIFCSAFCLDEFKLSDLVQKLPQCPHYFHSKCTDEWIKRELEASEKAEIVSALSEPRTPEDTLRTISMPCPLCRRRLREVAVAGISKPEPAHVLNAQRLDSVVVGEV